MNIQDEKLYKITLALAGIFQAVSIVRDLARTGTTNEVAFEVSINSIYKIDTANVEDVYGGVQGVQLGLKELMGLLGSERITSDPDISRYVVSLMHLERRLQRNTEIKKTLTRRIKHAVSQANYFSSMHATVMASLADIYINTLGTLPFRLQVLGNSKHLGQAEIVNKIRAALLAGIRSVVLWRQMGGTRFQLFFMRGKLAKMAQQILTA